MYHACCYCWFIQHFVCPTLTSSDVQRPVFRRRMACKQFAGEKEREREIECFTIEILMNREPIYGYRHFALGQSAIYSIRRRGPYVQRKRIRFRPESKRNEFRCQPSYAQWPHTLCSNRIISVRFPFHISIHRI